MKPTLLFPSGFKIIGLILLIPGLILTYLLLFQNKTFAFFNYGIPKVKYSEFAWIGRDTLTDETAITFIIIGLIFIGFSKVKNESDSTHRIRLKALYSSTFANCMLTTILYALDTMAHRRTLLDNMILYQLFFLLPIFILRFYYLLRRFKKSHKKPTLYLLPYSPFNLLGKIVSLTCLVFAIGFWLLNIKVPDSIAIACIPGVFFWIWSKEKRETKATTSIRLKAMQIAVYINYVLLLITTWVFYGFDYLNVLFISLASIQVVFLIVFYGMLFYTPKPRHRAAVN